MLKQFNILYLFSALAFFFTFVIVKENFSIFARRNFNLCYSRSFVYLCYDTLCPIRLFLANFAAYFASKILQLSLLSFFLAVSRLIVFNLDISLYLLFIESHSPSLSKFSFEQDYFNFYFRLIGRKKNCR